MRKLGTCVSVDPGLEAEALLLQHPTSLAALFDLKLYSVADSIGQSLPALSIAGRSRHRSHTPQQWCEAFSIGHHKDARIWSSNYPRVYQSMKVVIEIGILPRPKRIAH